MRDSSLLDSFEEWESGNLFKRLDKPFSDAYLYCGEMITITTGSRR